MQQIDSLGSYQNTSAPLRIVAQLYQRLIKMFGYLLHLSYSKSSNKSIYSLL